MKLASSVITSGGSQPVRSMLFLHGLLGTRANWRGLARRFVDARPDWAAVLVDLREHGESLGLEGPATVEQCAQDLLALDCIPPIRGALGHSFGGKVAMRWAELAGASVDELWVIDSTPSERPTGAGEARRVLGILGHAKRDFPDGFADRAEFTRYVVGHGEAQGIADWLAMNLSSLPNGRRGLRVDLGSLGALLDDYGRTDTWSALEQSGPTTQIHMVIGGRSNLVDESDRVRLNRMADVSNNMFVHLIDTAGHWVHVDAPERLIELLTKMH